MNSRCRFLAALNRQTVDRPPLWIMRQAGRYLPEYRALKERHSFREMIANPELATEVTLMPLKRFPLDAAITFSDILVVPEALGFPYDFDNQRGITLPRRLRAADFAQQLSELKQIDPSCLVEKLSHVFATQRALRSELGSDTALLGFSGTPWTLACYMIEGGGSDHYAATKALALENPAALEELLELLANAVAEYLRQQAAAGVDAVQLFDSAAPGCPAAHYDAWSLRWVRRIVELLNGVVPVIYFVRGMTAQLDAIAATGVTALSLDWTCDLPIASAHLADRTAVQGNFDPVLLGQHPDIVRREVARGLEAMRGAHGFTGYIANLGHGILPSARLDAVEAFVETVAESARP